MSKPLENTILTSVNKTPITEISLKFKEKNSNIISKNHIQVSTEFLGTHFDIKG